MFKDSDYSPNTFFGDYQKRLKEEKEKSDAGKPLWARTSPLPSFSATGSSNTTAKTQSNTNSSAKAASDAISRIGSEIKTKVKSVLSKKYGELDTRHLFDDIDDKDIEDNIETAENAIKTNIDRGTLSKNTLPKLPNLRDGLALSYAAANKGNSKAATKAREAAYMEQESTKTFDNLLTNTSANQPTKQSSFYEDYLKKKEPSKNNNNFGNKLAKDINLPNANKNPRYVKADVLNMRSAPGMSSKVVGTLTNGTEVNYTGNKTKEIDGHLWAEVTYDGKTGWVAADYLKTEKPQNNSVPTSVTHQKPVQSASVDTVNNGSKIDINDYSALQTAFNDVRKPGATADNPGDPGDFDGVWGLQCVDLSNWFLDNYTTLGRVGGDGKDIVTNLAIKNNSEVSKIPTAPSVYSVAGRSSGPGTSGSNDGGCGHTGVILSCKLTDTGDYELTYFHSYNSLLGKGKTSEITTRIFTPEQLKNTTFFDLKNHMS